MNLSLEKVSPMMAQWEACKKQAKDAIVFFRLGDFYEAFHEDAVLISRELNLTLTKRQEVPMSGVPFHASEAYIDRLVAKGYRIAIVEQMEDPAMVKGLVRREIVRFVTPGTLMDSSLLREKANNYFLSLYSLNTTFGLALLDLSTGELRIQEIGDPKSLIDELFRLSPAEILTSEKCKKGYPSLFDDLKQGSSFALSVKPDAFFDHKSAYETVASHFKVRSLDGFGMKGMIAAINATGALFTYLGEELNIPVHHIQTIQLEDSSKVMSIDKTTQKNLELFEHASGKSHAATLLNLIDHTSTPMGGRLLKRWLSHPLLDLAMILERQEAIAAFLLHADPLHSILRRIRDLERLIMRIETGFATPRDLTALAASLEQIPFLREALSSFEAPLIRKKRTSLSDVSRVAERIRQAIVDEPPLRLHEGGIFREGFHPELDQWRLFGQDGLTWLARYQTSLRESTGIRTLKVGFTKIFGYYIEVSRGRADKIPESFERRQTLVNSERFVTQELKDYEEKILRAEEKISSLEKELFEKLKKEIQSEAEVIKEIAKSVSEIDCLTALSMAARKYQYCRPIIDESDTLVIHEGRHPVVESLLPKGHFVPNDLTLGENRLVLITGPNMAGKSTFIRQVALIVVLAQMGSFVPAEFAHIGLVDRLFSRIGASDDLSRGQSTFMVEMSETAHILHNATPRSLVILDEIGRGTSTYDGISIAWSVAEYLLTQPEKRAKTLFATHYFELTELSQKIPGVLNLHVAVSESGSEIIFLHKILPGIADKSYGIFVAKLAGLPATVIRKSFEMLAFLEKSHSMTSKARPSQKSEQLLLFTPAGQNPFELILAELKTLDINQLTPLQAHLKLAELIQHSHAV